MPDVVGAGCALCLCMPLLLDNELSLLEEALQNGAGAAPGGGGGASTGDGGAGAPGADVVQRYLSRGSVHPCVGSITIGTDHQDGFSDGCVCCVPFAVWLGVLIT